jgi:hypothetical protein
MAKQIGILSLKSVSCNDRPALLMPVDEVIRALTIAGSTRRRRGHLPI